MKILITGAGGHIAKILAEELDGCSLVFLTTRKNKADGKKFFYWNPERGEIDSHCVRGVSHVVHLAGKSINSRWTKANKSAIRSSRIDGARLIFETCKAESIQLESFISAGGLAVYGDGWLSEVCRDWEAAAYIFEELGARSVVMRLPVLINKNSSFVKTVKPAARLGMAVSFGRKDMRFPWAHTRDVARFVAFAIENKLQGAFPLIAAEPTQGELQKTMARKWAGFALALILPASIVKLIFGEKSEILLTEHDVNLSATLQSGFKFIFFDLSNALDE